MSLSALLQAVAPLVKGASRAILITGTPALSRPIELYPQVHIFQRLMCWKVFFRLYSNTGVQQ